MRVSFPWLSLLLATADAASNTTTSLGPFLKPLESATGWIIGNAHWNITIGDVYGTQLFFKGRDLIGDAVGHYSGYGTPTLSRHVTTHAAELNIENRWRKQLPMDVSERL